jgi:BirA family transcriptional regulator, biotin operon repressor / biotin---[acetyl-CoA-carboxylase] ligase
MSKTIINSAERVLYFKSLPSTNVAVLDAARHGEEGPLWIVAEVQTSGRGRRGRTWVSKRGNLYATLLLTNPCPLDVMPELCLVAGVALHQALTTHVPSLEPRLKLKWPNDIMLDDAKLAGILIESEQFPVGKCAVAIGIGVNVMDAPVLTDRETAALKNVSEAVSTSEIFSALQSSMSKALHQWDRGRGFDQVREAWMKHAWMRGQMITLEAGQETRCGILEGIDLHGALCIQCPGGERHVVHTGEVMNLRPHRAL